MCRSYCFHKLNVGFYFNLLFILLILLSLSDCSEDTVHINFPKTFNNTKFTERYFYSPPSTSDGVVIDNRIKAIYSNVHNYDGFGFYRVYRRNKQLLNSNLRIEGDLSSGLVKINEMACENSAASVYFRVSLSSAENANHPIIENSDTDFCKMETLNGNEYRINFNLDQFANCGIIDCSNESETFYCLTLRFPYISGLKLKEDFMMTLQCKPRKRVVSHVMSVNYKSLDTIARINPLVAIGGYKNSFETDVGLYRRTFGSDVFDAKIEAGGVVILGEELLLRVAVKEGDGWHQSKIAEVKAHHLEKDHGKKLKINTMWMLDSNGCVNSRIREIFPGEQYKASPLENYLLFEAFMFENMKDNDEMVLSIRVVGCIDNVDCALNCPSSHLRKTRSLITNDNNNRTSNWKNDVSFRIIIDEKKNHSEKDFYIYFMSIVFYILFALSFGIVLISVWLLKCFLKQRKSFNYD